MTEKEDSESLQQDVLACVLPRLGVGDCVHIHDEDCAIWGDRAICSCVPLTCWGPSAEA